MEAGEDTIAVVESGSDKCMNQGSGSGEEKTWTETGHVLEVEKGGFSNLIDVMFQSEHVGMG